MYSAMHESIDTNVKKGKNKNLLNQLTPNIYRLTKDGMDVKITKRELAILKNLSLGCTLKETSQNLKLSPRTVEEYFNNIKF
jgi:DNA-binding NarL/FixJ family response regulator